MQQSGFYYHLSSSDRFRINLEDRSRHFLHTGYSLNMYTYINIWHRSEKNSH
ncbi:hypothetical protein Hanom_Chr04g00298591 [Helianthus anomalus]